MKEMGHTGQGLKEKVYLNLPVEKSAIIDVTVILTNENFRINMMQCRI